MEKKWSQTFRNWCGFVHNGPNLSTFFNSDHEQGVIFCWEKEELAKTKIQQIVDLRYMNPTPRI